MTKVDTWGPYVETELSHWGREFALHRDCEYLGHQSKNMLQVLIEHKGEMPARPTGFKPLDTCRRAQAIEDIIKDLASPYGMCNPDAANVLRAWYAGTGRRGVERLQIACELVKRKLNRRNYYTLHDIGFAYVSAVLFQKSKTA